MQGTSVIILCRWIAETTTIFMDFSNAHVFWEILLYYSFYKSFLSLYGLVFKINNKLLFVKWINKSIFYFSGAEDKHGYVWDRHYGVCLARLPHTDVVNAVAFNPKDPEMLITVGDDQLIKVYQLILFKWIFHLLNFFINAMN